jgi:uncharacterized protein YbgA (DUF1722 family)/uncharacterized protein YbbK (DUF523 family)
MNKYERPRIIISKCIEFENCRYNGQIIRNEFVARIKDYVDFIPICPEYEIGLGIPRNPIRIIEKENVRQLIQPATGRDVTIEMNEFCGRYLSTLKDIDGFLLKSQSPSCGIKDVKIYPRSKDSAPMFRDGGLFGKKVCETYPYLAIEDDARLRNSSIKEHFLKKIYTFAEFRKINNTLTIKDLIDFHTKNKLLLMSYNQRNLKEMGKLVSNTKEMSAPDLVNEYKNTLFKTFQKGPRCTSNINILQHAFGYISKYLTKEEKQMFLNSMNEYRNKKISLEIPIAYLKSWILRFDEHYLRNQTFFEPYPSELHDAESIQICPSKDYW